MAENSAISWCHHTFNLGWGCFKKSAGCANCYAARDSKRYGFDIWGKQPVRRLLSKKYYNKPKIWNNKAEKLDERHRVFCGSMMDWTDECWYAMLPFLWQTWRDTPHLDWLMLTKNSENIKDCLPPDWGSGYDNVWIGITAENQKQANIRVPELLKIPAKIRFISAEPLLENVLFDNGVSSWLTCNGQDKSGVLADEHVCCESNDIQGTCFHGIDWIITGGESGKDSRPMNPDWARLIYAQCKSESVPFFMKQMSGNTKALRDAIPDDLRIQQFP